MQKGVKRSTVLYRGEVVGHVRAGKLYEDVGQMGVEVLPRVERLAMNIRNVLPVSLERCIANDSMGYP